MLLGQTKKQPDPIYIIPAVCYNSYSKDKGEEKCN